MKTRQSAGHWLRAILVGAMLGWGLATHALACACCGLDDLWDVDTTVLNDYEQTVVKGLKLSAVQAYLTNSPGDDSIAVSHPRITPRRLSFQSELGVFEMALPARVTRRRSDITFLLRPGPRRDENEASIFHEWSWQGVIKVPTEFRRRWAPNNRDAEQPLRATLALQGRGNTCVGKSSFQRWVLTVHGTGYRVAGPVR